MFRHVEGTEVFMTTSTVCSNVLTVHVYLIEPYTLNII